MKKIIVLTTFSVICVTQVCYSQNFAAYDITFEYYCESTTTKINWLISDAVGYWQGIECTGYNQLYANTYTVTESGNYFFRYYSNADGWASECSIVYISVKRPGEVDAGPDQTICSYNGRIQVSCTEGIYYRTEANSSGPYCEGSWSQLSGPAATIVSPTSNLTDVVFTEIGEYNFRFTKQILDCAPVFDDVTVVVTGESIELQAYISSKYPMINDFVELTLSSSQEATYTVNWGDGNITTTSSNFLEHIYATKGKFNIGIKGDPVADSVCSDSTSIVVETVLCLSSLPDNMGEFVMDKLTGDIYYQQDGCASEFSFGCLMGPGDPISNVVSSESMVYNDKWNHRGVVQLSPLQANAQFKSNQFETAARGKWRSQSAFAYKNSLYNKDKNYIDGRYNMYVFNWENTAINRPEWIKQTTREYYSPNGEAIQERNALDIASSAKFGYYEAVPVLTATNAEYASVVFESFEVAYGHGQYDNGIEVTGGISTGTAHGGNTAVELTAGGKIKYTAFKLTKPVQQRGITIKFWSSRSSPVGYQVSVLDEATSLVSAIPVWLAVTGNWSLMQVNFSAAQLASVALNRPVTIQVMSNQSVLIDDFRIQPIDSQMSCYVYDANNLRLLTVFDDQHYGLYYHYNDEGKLVRKLIETEKGTRTIQETFYNRPGEIITGK